MCPKLNHNQTFFNRCTFSWTLAFTIIATCKDHTKCSKVDVLNIPKPNPSWYGVVKITSSLIDSRKIGLL